MKKTLICSLACLAGCAALAGCQEKPERVIIIELADPSDEWETGLAVVSGNMLETETGTVKEENVSDPDTHIPELFLDGMVFKITSIYAGKPIIALLLKEANPDWQYDSIGLYDVALLQAAEEAFDFGLYCGDAEVTLYQAGEDRELQEIRLEADGGGLASYRADAGQDHWLVVYLGTSLSRMDTPEAQETEPEAAASLEGMTEPEEESAGNQTTKHEADTAMSPAATIAPETTKRPDTPASPTTASQTTPAAPATPATTAPPAAVPPTTAHQHTWVPATRAVHHDATYKQVWVEDAAAWDETVVLQEAYDEQVVVQESYDEPVIEWVDVCNECGHKFLSPEDDIDVHMGAGCWSSWHAEPMQTGTIHHDAVYQMVHHDAVTQAVHHDAQGHYENAVDQVAWDETVTTGYTCTGCGAAK